ncbi:hypothetical protein HAX54_003730 [Datura stramonium]|uniref:Uncharacterized protein n=1 Tax=Datura stramonium TaxID=4076 RepID=A0ABS8WUW7_DATST|nr:hypothetical protein [Datura stramonium]
MAPKVNKGNGVSFLSHENKRSSGTQEEPNEDARLPPQPPRRYGLHWVTEQEDRFHTLRLNFVFNDPGECDLNMVREFLANWD